VDELGTTKSVARDVIKAETVINFTVKSQLIERIAERLGAVVARQMQTYFRSDIK